MTDAPLPLAPKVRTINKKMALVLPIDVGPENRREVHYVYSMPLPHEVFKRYWMVFSKTFATIYNEKLHMMAGPRIAAMALRDHAEQMGVLEEINLGVMAELRRLSFFIFPQEGKGWTQFMLDDAVNTGLITQDDFDEVENILTFFTVSWSMHRAGTREVIMAGAAKLWDAQIISSSCSEFIASLPKLTAIGNSGPKVKVG